MQAKWEDVIETVMSLPPESKMKLAELLQKDMVEQQEAANSPISEEIDELGEYASVRALMSKADEPEGYARVQALYDAGEIEKADRLKAFLNTLDAYAEIDEPDIEAEDIYRERERNVARDELDKYWYAKVESLYETGKVEEADNLKCLLDIMTTCADADEPDLDVDAMYRERLNNVSREPLFN